MPACKPLGGKLLDERPIKYSQDKNAFPTIHMCKTCFDKEYLSFPTYKDFENFDLILTKKLSLGGLKYIRDDGKDLQHGYSIYQCNDCNMNWWLDEPENAWRGFFAHEDTAKKIIDGLSKENKRGQIGCYIILAIVGVVIISSVFKYCSS